MQTQRIAASIGATVALLGFLAVASPASASTATRSSVTTQPEYDGLTDGMIYTGTYETYADCSARLWVFGLPQYR